MTIHDWLSSAQYDIDSAISLLDEFRLGHCLVMCRGCLEKMLKACWIRRRGEHPPHRTSLLYLASRLEIPMDDPQVDLLATLSLFEADPEENARWKELRRSLTQQQVQMLVSRTEEFIGWVKPILNS